MEFCTALGRVDRISLGRRENGGEVVRDCALSLQTETGSLALFFNDIDDINSLPGQDMQRYPAMVELITQCHLAGLPVLLGYESDTGGAEGGELRSIQATVDWPERPKGSASRVEQVILKGKGMNSASFQFSISPPSALGTVTLRLGQPLTRLSGAISAALAQGTGIRVTEEQPTDTTPEAAAISVHAS